MDEILAGLACLVPLLLLLVMVSRQKKGSFYDHHDRD